MSHKKLTQFIVKVSVLCYFPLYNNMLLNVFKNTNLIKNNHCIIQIITYL